jgi:hypothetical protein
MSIGMIGGNCASQHNKHIGNRKFERPEFDAGGYSSGNTRYDRGICDPAPSLGI